MYDIKVGIMSLSLLMTPSFMAAHEADKNSPADTSAILHAQIEDVLVCAPYSRMESSHTPLFSHLDSKSLFYNQPRTLPEALQGMPGVWVQQTDHGGGSPILRGMIGYQTVMLVDGIRLNNAMFQSGPLPYLNTVDGMAMDNVGVLLGAASVAYGSDAMGGVIYMQSQSAPFLDSDRLHVHGRLLGTAATSGMEYSGRGELNVSNRTWAMHVGVDDKRFGDIHAGKGLGIERPTGYGEWAVDSKLRHRMGAYSVLTVAYQGKRQSHIPNYLQMRSGKYEKYETRHQDRDLAYASYAFRPEDMRLKYFETTVSYSRLKVNNFRVLSSGKSSDATNDVRSVGFTADVGVKPFPWLMTKAGVDAYHDKVFSDGNFPNGSTMLTYAAFVEADAELNRWTFGAGTRYSGHRLSLPTSDFGNVRLSPDAFVGNVHASYALLPHLRLTMVVASSFRAPNINDLAKMGADDSWYFVPNYNLSPERGLNKEISVRFDNGSTMFSANVYRNDLHDLMAMCQGTTSGGATEVDGMPVRMRANVDKAYIEGFELAARQVIDKHFSVSGNMSFTYGQNKTEHMPLSKIPPLSGMACIRYQGSRVAMSLKATMASKQTRLSKQDQEDARIPEGGTPGWTCLDYNVEYTIGHVMLAGIFGNILNKAYRLHASGVDANGIYGKLSVAYSF